MKILVAGAGFIGHWLVHKLQDDHEVHILDMDDEIPTWRWDKMDKIERFYHSNTVNFSPVDDYDVVIYTASTANAIDATVSPFLANEGMIGGPVNVIQQARYEELKQFIYLSSSMVYGDFNGLNPRESDPLDPQEPYGMMKRCGEEMVKFYCERYNVPYTIIRPSAVYGPGDHIQRVISIFIERALKGNDLIVKGNNSLDFTYIEDLVDGIIQTIGHKGAMNETFNLTRGKAVGLFDAANAVIRAVGKGAISLEDHDPHYPVRGALDISKARTAFGYDPKTNIQQGIRKYVEWRKDFDASSLHQP